MKFWHGCFSRCQPLPCWLCTAATHIFRVVAVWHLLKNLQLLHQLFQSWWHELQACSCTITESTGFLGLLDHFKATKNICLKLIEVWTWMEEGNGSLEPCPLSRQSILNKIFIFIYKYIFIYFNWYNIYNIHNWNIHINIY